MASETAARVRDLVKTYWTESAQVRALQGFDAEFPSAAVTAVVGPSGSGKSTLLRLLAGIDHPTSGSIYVGGLELSAMKPRELRRLRRNLVGYVFQRPPDNFIPYLTVAEHMGLARRTAAHGGALDQDELLERLGIAHRRDHMPHELSGGEQQRAAFAQVLVAGPSVVVADEPTAELDSVSGEHLLELVVSMRETGVAFVIATHDHKLSELADHTIEIDHGQLKAEAPHHMRVRHDPEVIALARGHALYRRPLSVAAPEGARPAADLPLATVDAVTKSYRRGSETVHALDGVSLRLEAGSLIGLMGRSGSGKTTLLNVVAGWERPDAGAVRWEDGEGERLRLWHELAVVPQKLGLIDELTVRENVQYPARLAGRLHELGDRVEDLLEEFGLADLADRIPSETSVGQQQRTALARALVLSPRLLLADEPSGHQDAGWGEGVFKALRHASYEGTCVLVATHNEALAPFLDRVVTMQDGRITSFAEDRTIGPRA